MMTSFCTRFRFARSARRLLAGVAGVVATLPLPAAGPALGLHMGKDNSLTQYEEFGDWLGRKVLYRVVFCDMTSWNGIASPWFLTASQNWIGSDPGRIEVISLPLLPEGDAGNFSAITSGAHDADFRSFGEKIQARGIASRVIVRLAWEGNGDWYPWSYAANPAGFRDAFRRAVQLMREKAPALRIDWCVSCRSTRRGGPAGWREGYPGDDVVDIISMDVYDEYDATWDLILNGEAGLRELRDFAISRNKPEAYPEWGCSTNTSAQGGGDNPEFVENMANWFWSRPDQVVYQGYWNVTNSGPMGTIFGLDPLPAPLASAKYRRLFSVPQAPTSPLVK